MMANELPINLKLPEGFLSEEIRCGYLVSSEMKAIWAVELDLLNEFIKVCDKYGIPYYASGGTLLGAIRHGGFIPWDDDIDLQMYRQDFEKFCIIAEKEFAGRYFWQTEKTDPSSGRGHAQLRNSETTGILFSEKDRNYPFNQGIFIDIFPIDNIPDTESEQENHFKELNILIDDYRDKKFLEYAYRFEWNKNIPMVFYRFFLHLWYRFTHKYKKAYRLYEEKTQAYNKEETKSVVLTPFTIPNFTFRKSDIKNPTSVPFEFISINVPEGYENLLIKQYGNWRKFVIGGNLHGEVLFDANTPYKVYLER